MPCELPDLPFPADALEPHISSRTLLPHHGKHHRAYVEKANTLARDAGPAEYGLEDIIRRSAANPSPRPLYITTPPRRGIMLSTVIRYGHPQAAPHGASLPGGFTPPWATSTGSPRHARQPRPIDPAAVRLGSCSTAHGSRSSPPRGRPASLGQGAAPRDRRVGARLLPRSSRAARRLRRRSR